MCALHHHWSLSLKGSTLGLHPPEASLDCELCTKIPTPRLEVGMARTYISRAQDGVCRTSLSQEQRTWCSAQSSPTLTAGAHSIQAASVPVACAADLRIPFHRLEPSVMRRSGLASTRRRMSPMPRHWKSQTSRPTPTTGEDSRWQVISFVWRTHHLLKPVTSASNNDPAVFVNQKFPSSNKQ